MPLWRGSAAGSVLTSSAKHLAVDAVGDPGLGAVDDVGVVAVAHRARCGSPAGRCRSRARSARGRRAARRSRSAAGSARFCSSVPTRSHAGRHDQVRVEDAGERHPHLRDPLHDPGVGRGARGRARRRPVPMVAPNRPSAFICSTISVGIDVVVLERMHVRPHVPLQPLADRVEDGGFFVSRWERRGFCHRSLLHRCHPGACRRDPANRMRRS